MVFTADLEAPGFFYNKSFLFFFFDELDFFFFCFCSGERVCVWL